MATLRSDELLKTCPYNPSHQIAPSRFDIHLIKCAKSSTVKLEKCPFYSTHRIPKELMAAHVLECEHARRDICSMVEREKTEWELLDVKKIPQVSEAAKLAEAMGAMAIESENGPKEEVEEQQSVTDLGWNYTGPTELYLTPGLEDGKAKATTAYGSNMFRYHNMTPAERRKFNDKLVSKAMNRAARHSNKEAIDKEKEMLEKREQEKKEEQEQIEKEKEERERQKKEREAKQKAKKEKIKAAKRAAFIAAQNNLRSNSQESDNE